jgi:very-short-patch-repair endonuclease
VPHSKHALTGDIAVARIAGSQRGVITRRQLMAAGVGRGAIAHRLKKARLHRLHPEVYLVGHHVPAPLAHETAALLACGDGAVLSHVSAAALWGFALADNDRIDVIVPGRHRGRLFGVRVHESRALVSEDIRSRESLPVTAPARTLLDYAEVVAIGELERAVAEARVMRLVDESELLKLLERSPGRHGAAPLRAVLDRAGGPAFTRSHAERRMLALLRKARLSPPRCNVVLCGYEVDFFWPDAKLVVEFDSWEFHRSREAFEKDRRRDADLQLAGFRVLRITWRRLDDEPEAVVAQIARAL